MASLLEERAFWAKSRAAANALRADPEALQQELDERAEWDGVLGDGLDDDDPIIVPAPTGHAKKKK